LDYQFYFLPQWKIEIVTWRNRNRRFREQTPWIFGPLIFIADNFCTAKAVFAL